MDLLNPHFLVSVLEIVWIDLLLSGDNAVVIAMACRALPEDRRRIGIMLGAATAVALRIVFALVVSSLLAVPFLRVVGGLLLVWIAVKLAVGEDEEAPVVDGSRSLWKAVRTIAIADAVMSLDNVVAIAAAAKGHASLFVFGLLLSIPLIVMGAALVTALLKRFPLIVWAGAALLGWIAGEMIVTDPFVAERVAGVDHIRELAAIAVTLLVVGCAYGMKRRAGLVDVSGVDRRG
ncbi:TerC family protein [Methylobacterium sp. BTF04]|uniref:TerC family protein n=1 Tax=Methylobacterium sp. BTF04 TaxID=2708300 RepID=UPI0013D4D434|nr:TerC family protein [Methylobacterium sp. BTF04]NEU10941.1 TerC family protein [Methylobacterium sp. BTF04]